MVPTVTPKEAEAARLAAERVVETHRRLSAFLRVGQTLAEIDGFVASTLADLKCRSAFKGYRVPRTPPFPSHACLSLNSCIVHGTAGSAREPIKAGDVLKIDIGVVHQGWIGDAGWTYVFGDVPDEVAHLCQTGKESLRRGIEALRPGNTYMDWAKAVQGHVEVEQRLHLVRGLGGHGYGRKLHMRPYISNTMPTYPGEWADAFTPCTPGTLVAVEPMLAIGTGHVVQERNAWPVYIADGSQCAHYEHDVLITENGPDVLTAGLWEIEDVIRR